MFTLRLYNFAFCRNDTPCIVLGELFANITKAENKIIIELQIKDEILTNVDFLNEKNYLIALNNNLKNIPKNQSPRK